jgi:hypothetical protein
MGKKAKSKLFSKLDMTRDENFGKDLRVLLSLTESAIAHLAGHAAKVWLARGDEETDMASDEASTKLKVPRAQLDHALRLSSFLLSKFLKDGEGYGDKPENIVSDLETNFEISFEEKRGALLTLVKDLKNLAEQKGDMKVRQRYALRSLPVLEVISTSADYRLVFDKKFGVTSEISSYQPKCLDAVPVAIIQLVFDSGPTKNVFFQADRRSLRLLIDYLRAVDRELDIGQRLLDVK